MKVLAYSVFLAVFYCSGAHADFCGDIEDIAGEARAGFDKYRKEHLRDSRSGASFSSTLLLPGASECSIVVANDRNISAFGCDWEYEGEPNVSREYFSDLVDAVIGCESFLLIDEHSEIDGGEVFFDKVFTHDAFQESERFRLYIDYRDDGEWSEISFGVQSNNK